MGNSPEQPKAADQKNQTGKNVRVEADLMQRKLSAL
jgi:hypothetical protein